MIKRYSRILALFMVIITLLTVGGVYATFIYAENPPGTILQDTSLRVESFSYVPGAGQMVSGEVAVTEKFVQEVNKIVSDPNQTQLDEIIEARKDKGSWFFSINELAADDPEAEGLRELLGIDNYPELTVIIKFTSGVPAYELYTTRVDVDAKDENGNYIIPETEFKNETTYIYPVNRTTFQVLADGTYSAQQVTVGYSRAIYYYETPTSQSTTRTYDVSTWAEGTSYQTAVNIESDIIGKEITVQNTAQQKEVYFKFTVSSAGRYYFNTSVAGLSAKIYNSSYKQVTNNNLSARTTYYLKLNYQTEGEPQDFKFTLSK